ncbi:hypothetical protein AJ79_05279 [Helicocarpus griseus UAMH5409]|uniref:Uncharacterized protein n=1 Tax=Helicocarpus griseus UAMH5409 TaxID=1447875 RepID=A0A2B7XNR5_9EURO|nr:hypothetical protein AJ79_05279 [Helicocarpus griseus UAMH5409]
MATSRQTSYTNTPYHGTQASSTSHPRAPHRGHRFNPRSQQPYTHDYNPQIALELELELERLGASYGQTNNASSQEGEGYGQVQEGWNYTELIRGNGDMQYIIPPSRGVNRDGREEATYGYDARSTWSKEVLRDNSSSGSSKHKSNNKKISRR